MSNRRKIRKRMFQTQRRKNGNRHTPNLIREDALDKIDVPKVDKEVIKVVPARAGDEIIGEAVIYEDGTIDVIVHGEISEKAKADVYSFKQTMLGLDEEDVDGSPR